MMENLLSKKYLLIFSLFLSALFTGKQAQAQYATVSTLPTYTANNGYGLVTFNFRNTNSYPIMIDTIYMEGSSAGNDRLAYLWISNNPVNGQPAGAIPTNPAWTLEHSEMNNYPTSNTQTPMMTGIGLIIPANTTVGMAVGGFSGGTLANPGAGFMGYYTIPSTTSTPDTFETNGVEIITGPNISYGYTSYTTTTANHPRGFVGSIVFQPINQTPCSGVPSISLLTNDTAVCANQSFSIAAQYIQAADIEYQWQESPAGQNIWTNITGAIGNSYNVASGITTSTDYRLIAHCTNSNLSDTSDVIEITVKPANECYCTPSTGGGTSYYIANFSTSGAAINIDNSVSSGSASGYQDFSNISAFAHPGTDIGYSISPNNTSTYGRALWIDWNQNGTFESNEQILSSTSYASGPFNGTISIPANTPSGEYKLRALISFTPSNPSDPCLNSGSGEYQDYTLEIAPMPSCDTVSTPSGWELTSSLDTICVEDDITLNVEPFIIASDVTYQFQSSNNGTSWNNIGAASSDNSLAVNDINQDTYFRVQWLCNGVVSGTSNVVHVPVVNPEILTTTDGYVCGEGTVDLHATASPGSNVVWYENPTGGNPIHQGENFTTPILNANTSYWVGAGLGSSADPDEFVGTGNFTITGTPNPFYTTWWGSKNQFLIKASELTALGYSAGSIQEVIFDVAANNGLDLNNFEIKIGQTNLNDLTATFQTGLTTVYTASGTTVLSAIGEKVFELDDPFYWDGTSNLIIETCFNNNNWSGGNSVVGTQSLGFAASTYQYADNANVCSQTSGYTSQNRPNIKLKIDMGCLSDLEEVQAIVYPELVLDIEDTIKACIGDTVTLDVGSGFESYLWDDNSTEHYIEVTSPGAYTVVVENLGCVKEKTIIVEYYDYPTVDLGEDIYSCFGDTLILDAGNPGMYYQWNTGDTTRMIQVYNGGVYTVEVSNGICSTEDEIEVFLQDVASGWAIDNYDLGNRLFEFLVVDPVEVTGYLWDFGDGSPQSDLEFPTHQYAADGVYTVTVALNSEGCGPGDTLMRHVIVRTVGVDELNNDQALTVYPNPAKDYVNIELGNSSKIEKIALQDVNGRVIEMVDLEKQNVNTYKMYTGHLPSGVYMILIQTNEGLHTRNLELIK